MDEFVQLTYASVSHDLIVHVMSCDSYNTSHNGPLYLLLVQGLCNQCDVWWGTQAVANRSMQLSWCLSKENEEY